MYNRLSQDQEVGPVGNEITWYRWRVPVEIMLRVVMMASKGYQWSMVMTTG